ncbi:TadE/TadG family type IV pilus assembly protein [Zobellella sp. An-6]|uniref:TadE/TadG family type IV pilus assembly protein n=1 Tax=Zobellella sp. An-6 TaxID=3400218 RepID=UPI0040415224
MDARSALLTGPLYYRADNKARKKQKGAAGVEAVLVLPVIMTLFYAIVTYGLIFYTQYLFNHIGSEALRRSVSYVNESCLIDGQDEGCDDTALKQQLHQQVESLLDDFLTDPDSIFGQPRSEALSVTILPGDCCVLQFSYNYQEHPFIPPLLPVPAVISSRASLQL